MRLRDLTKNLVDYDESTEEIKINKRIYRVSPEFVNSAPNAFIGQAFGSGREYNELIANSIKDAREYYDSEIPIFTQTEIGMFLKEGLRKTYNFGAIYKEGETSEIISKVDSYNVLKQISKKMDELNVSKNNVLFFAHPSHIYRVKDQGKIFGINGGVFFPKEITWPKNDPIKWVRNEKAWGRREKYGRIFLWIIGRLKRDL